MKGRGPQSGAPDDRSVMKQIETDAQALLRRQVAIVGAGSWGTSVAKVIAETHPGISVKMWAYEKQVAKTINDLHRNELYLAGVDLPANITATTALKDAVADSYVVLLATPSKVAFDTCQKMRRFLMPGAFLGFLTKGFCRIDNTIHLMSEAIAMALPVLEDRIVAVYGPSHAEEVCRGFHTCLCVAGKSEEARKEMAWLLSCDYLECRELDDIVGVELGGTLKNPAAIAAGMLHVLPRCGDNLAGALMAEALKEMLRIAESFDAKSETIIDISGLGDLIATSLSDHSRNRKFGKDIGRQILRTGKSVGLFDRIVLRFRPEYVLEKMSRKLHYLAEGAYAIEPLIELAEERDIFIPVYRSLYEILLNNREPRLLIETVKNPDRFEEILKETKIHVTRRKRGMERARGTFFRNMIIKSAVEKFGAGREARQELLAYRNQMLGAEYVSSVRDRSRRRSKEVNLLYALDESSVEPVMPELCRLYLGEISDRFSPTASALFWLAVRARNFLANLFVTRYGKGLFRSNIRISGDIEKVRSVAGHSNLLYAVMSRSGFDYLFATLALARTRLHPPRFFIPAGYERGRLAALFLRLAGGYRVDPDRLDNPAYRETLKAYISTLIQHGIPVLFFPEISVPHDGKPGIINEGVMEAVFESLYQSTEEIAVVPVEISYYLRPSDEPQAMRNADIPLGSLLRNTVHVNLSDPILLSDYSHRKHFQSEVIHLILYHWMHDAMIYPHYIFCRVMREYDFSLEAGRAKKAVKQFLKKHGLHKQYRAKDVVRAGIEFFRVTGIGGIENGVLVAHRQDEIEYYANLARKG